MGLSLPKYQLVAGTQADAQMLEQVRVEPLQRQRPEDVSFEQNTVSTEKAHL
jgi:hypothetical protein